MATCGRFCAAQSAASLAKQRRFGCCASLRHSPSAAPPPHRPRRRSRSPGGADSWAAGRLRERGLLRAAGCVPRDADAAAIKKAYKKAALKHHPDKQGGDEDTFKKLVGSPHPIEGLSSPHSAPRSLGTRN